MQNNYNQHALKQVQFAPVAATLPAENLSLNWSSPMPAQRVSKPGKIEKKFLNVMDHFFTILLLISGEEEYETISIGHIL